MTRRGYLRTVGAVLVALFGPKAGGHIGAYGCSIENAALAHRIEQLFSDTDSARAVGLQCLARSPGSAFGALDRIRKLANASCDRGAMATLEEQLIRQRREDFASGRSVIIDGWVIARCEADLCTALVCLTHG